jgi:DtxR family Mn-dependent transcriptional regulator
MNLVDHKRYHGVRLTEGGLKIALEIIRHHRLVELYLTEALGVPWDKVHAEAEKWEHVLSEDLEDRMDAILGHPTEDPHGAPIPDRSGQIIRCERFPLGELDPGKTATVVEVMDQDPELLRYLSELGLVLRTKVTLVKVEPFDGPLMILIDDIEHGIGRKAASQILVAV